MKIVVEKQPKCQASLTVVIPAEKVSEVQDQMLKGYVSKAKIQGFRPGKAPKAVVAKRFAQEIAEEVQSFLMDEAFNEAMKQNEGLKVLDFGTPKDILQEQGGLSFSTTMLLAPEITLPDYKGITVTVPSEEVSKEEVDAQLQAIRERFADFKAVEGRPAQKEDFAVVDFNSTLNGAPLDEALGKSAGFLSGREGYWVRLVDEAFLPGYSKALEGMQVGENKAVAVTIPEDFPLSDLRGKEIVVHTTLKEIKEATLPELNDELIAKLAPGMTLEAATALITENLAEQRKEQNNDAKVTQIVDFLSSKVDVELPDQLVEFEAQNQANMLIRQAAQAGTPQEELLAQHAEILEKAKEQAEKNVKSNFLLQEIAQAEGLKVTDQELLSHLVQLANSRKVTPKKFIGDLQRSGRLQSVRLSLLVGKAIDFLVEQATVTTSDEAKA